MVLVILDGHHTRYKGRRRLEERGMLVLLQPGFTRTSLHDYQLGHILDPHFTLIGKNRCIRVFISGLEH